MEEVFREIKKSIHVQRKAALDFSPHIHEDIELVYVKKGGGRAVCDGKAYDLTEGAFFLVFPNQIHHYTGCALGEYFVVILKPSSLFSYGEVFLDGEPVSALYLPEPEEGTVIASLFEQACREFFQDGYSPIIQAYLTVVFGKLLRHYEIQKNPLARDTVLQILQYCSRHYREPVTVGEIAGALHISRSCISHIFSSRLSVNFCDYMNSLRLSDAVWLLENENYSMTEVANMSGFSTIRTFNRAFYKQYGMSPSAYRERKG